MNTDQLYEQLIVDIDKTLKPLLRVRTTEAMREERKKPGYIYEQKKSLHETWIALSQYSLSGNLSKLAMIINDRGMLLPDLLPSVFETKDDLVRFFELFKANKNNIIDSLNKIVGRPNRIVTYLPDNISLEEYLIKVMKDIHDESLNIEYNYYELIKLASSVSPTYE